MKKLILYLLIGYFVVQIAVPGYYVYCHFDILYNGESYKFDVTPRDPYDPFRGKYVSLRPSIQIESADGEYALLEKDPYGYAVILRWQKQKPSSGQYVKGLQLSRYYMNEKMAPEAEQIIQNSNSSNITMYLLVKIKNGNFVIQGLYVNDVPIEQYLQTVPNAGSTF